MPLSNLSSEIVSLIEGRKPGLLAACVPEGALLDPVGHVKVSLTTRQRNKIRTIPAVAEEDLRAWFTAQACDAAENTLLFMGHAVSSAQALTALMASRHFAQSDPVKSPCTVVVGAWNVVHVRSNWPAQGSPFESHHIEFCEGMTPAAIEELFHIRTPQGHPLERKAFIELIQEETGGQEWLCQKVLQKINVSAQQHDIAVVLRHLHESPSVVQEVERRRSELTDLQMTLLDELLDRRSLHVESQAHMIVAVELWLRGFARFRDAPHHALLHGSAFHLCPPAPVIERCLRPESQLVLAVPAVSAAILPLLFDIENVLRNLVSSVMTKSKGPDWTSTVLKRISVSHSSPAQATEDIREIVTVVLSELGLSKEDVSHEKENLQEKVSLLEVVGSAKSQLQQSHNDPTTGISDLCFLTFAQLIGILTHPDWFKDSFKQIFKLEAAQLRGKLDELRQIRNAVAHCYPLKFSQLERTRHIVQDLLDRMAWKKS